MTDTFDLARSQHFDTTHWKSAFALTFTLKQAFHSQPGVSVRLTEDQCRATFAHFLRKLNKAIFGATARHYGKRVKIIPVLEKDENGRWHYHAAIEKPQHVSELKFLTLLRRFWSQLDWGYERMSIEGNVDQGWIDYMLKPKQKSGLECWSDCIDWNNFYNPLADA